MPYRFYNVATGGKEELTPLEPGRVGLYVCGPTVYDHIHIGNARPLVVFDVLYRLLRERYEHVTYVRNITDIDDKILARAAESGLSVEALTTRTTTDFHTATAALCCADPSFEPRASAFIEPMIAFIEILLARGHAYVAEKHVLFHVPSMATYGRFARRKREEMIAGARVERAPYKKDAADFVLWKPSSAGQTGWESPWGRGRPGWHIECSAMSKEFLGLDFDIHGGGQDLIFPHHQNEIAQNLCAFPESGFARMWIHNGHVLVNREKMSKSLGNFVTVHEVLERFSGETLRLGLLQTHYRQPLDFRWDRLSGAQAFLQRTARILDAVPEPASEAAPDPEVVEALGDDLNTPLALSVLAERFKALEGLSGDPARQMAGQIRASGRLLGLWLALPQETSDGEEAWIEAQIEARARARREGAFAEADAIRAVLKEAGIVLEDGAEGTRWRRA